MCDIKWKIFPNHLVGSFRDLLEEQHFADVTLVSDDQIQTKAHKVVLSACSPVLKTLLVNNPHSHPLLYLRGINRVALKAILHFMYFGETKIPEKYIADFFSVAKDLKIEHLNDDVSLFSDNSKSNMELNEKSFEYTSVIKTRQNQEKEQIGIKDDFDYEKVEIKDEILNKKMKDSVLKSNTEGLTARFTGFQPKPLRCKACRVHKNKGDQEKIASSRSRCQLCGVVSCRDHYLLVCTTTCAPKLTQIQSVTVAEYEADEDKDAREQTEDYFNQQSSPGLVLED